MIYDVKCRLKNRSGMTLTELLVASIMIGVVMVGVASFGMAIRQLQSSTSKAVVLSMRTKAVMARLARDTYLAVGNNIERGIVPDGASNKSICFRHDNGTPVPYTDDEWTCYFEHSDNRLYLCGGPPTPAGNVPVNTEADCNANGGKTLLLDLDPGLAVFYDIVENADGRIEYVEFTLSAVYDNSTAVHPVENPRYTVTTRVNPQGHSR